MLFSQILIFAHGLLFIMCAHIYKCNQSYGSVPITMYIFTTRTVLGILNILCSLILSRFFLDVELSCSNVGQAAF